MIKARMQETNKKSYGQKIDKQELADSKNINMVKEYISSISRMEELDKPNSLLLKARMEAYLIEDVNETENFGQAYEDLVTEFPSFIDAYVHYWKYLKFRLTQLTGRNGSNVQDRRKTGLLKSAKQITD